MIWQVFFLSFYLSLGMIRSTARYTHRSLCVRACVCLTSNSYCHLIPSTIQMRERGRGRMWYSQPLVYVRTYIPRAPPCPLPVPRYRGKHQTDICHSPNNLLDIVTDASIFPHDDHILESAPSEMIFEIFITHCKMSKRFLFFFLRRTHSMYITGTFA